MFQAQHLSEHKAMAYQELAQQVRSLMDGESDVIANAANFSALVMTMLPDISWAGFYILRDGELVVGPFQGKPACIRIALGRGVCGTAAAERTSQLVPDVNAFADHIFCDPDSRSEVVIPLIRADGSLFGVWDVDSASIARFDDEDLAGMELLCQEFVDMLDR